MPFCASCARRHFRGGDVFLRVQTAPRFPFDIKVTGKPSRWPLDPKRTAPAFRGRYRARKTGRLAGNRARTRTAARPRRGFFCKEAVPSLTDGRHACIIGIAARNPSFSVKAADKTARDGCNTTKACRGRRAADASRRSIPGSAFSRSACRCRSGRRTRGNAPASWDGRS